MAPSPLWRRLRPQGRVPPSPSHIPSAFSLLLLKHGPNRVSPPARATATWADPPNLPLGHRRLWQVFFCRVPCSAERAEPSSHSSSPPGAPRSVTSGAEPVHSWRCRPPGPCRQHQRHHGRPGCPTRTGIPEGPGAHSLRHCRPLRHLGE